MFLSILSSSFFSPASPVRHHPVPDRQNTEGRRRRVRTEYHPSRQTAPEINNHDKTKPPLSSFFQPTLHAHPYTLFTTWSGIYTHVRVEKAKNKKLRKLNLRPLFRVEQPMQRIFHNSLKSLFRFRWPCVSSSTL